MPSSDLVDKLLRPGTNSKHRSTTSSNLSSSCIRDHCSHKPKAPCLGHESEQLILGLNLDCHLLLSTAFPHAEHVRVFPPDNLNFWPVCKLIRWRGSIVQQL